MVKTGRMGKEVQASLTYKQACIYIIPLLVYGPQRNLKRRPFTEFSRLTPTAFRADEDKKKSSLQLGIGRPRR